MGLKSEVTQQDAVRPTAPARGAPVVLAAPTGSGEDMIAVAAHLGARLAAFAEGRRTVSTAPIQSSSRRWCWVRRDRVPDDARATRPRLTRDGDEALESV